VTAPRPRIGLGGVAVAAVLAGCGGSLTSTGAPAADAAAPREGGIGGFSRPDALRPPDDIAFDARAMNLCPNKIAEPVDGTSCQFSIPDVAACTGFGIRVHVMIDLAEVPMLPDDGWTFTDATETVVELHGAACDRAHQSATGVTIFFTFYLP